MSSSDPHPKTYLLTEIFRAEISLKDLNQVSWFPLSWPRERHWISHNPQEWPPHTYDDGHFQKKKKKQMWSRMQRNWRLCTLLVGKQSSAATVEDSIALPQKIKNTVTYFWIHTIPHSKQDLGSSSFCVINEIIQYLFFSVWVTSLNIMSSSIICVVTNGRISFFFIPWYTYLLHFVGI